MRSPAPVIARWLPGALARSELANDGVLIMRTETALAVLLAILLPLGSTRSSEPSGPPIGPDVRTQHNLWVADALARMKTIKPGMTRADLLRVFAIPGGFWPDSSWTQTFEFEECRYFKVDVEFQPAAGSTLPRGSSADVIKKISTPYIGQVAND